MTFEEAIAFLNDADATRVRFGLDTTKRLLALLGDPQDHLKFVHIAGTNGKGSTAAFMESVLRQAGYRTGLYTSPHLVRFNERIRVNNVDISDADIALYTTQVFEAARQLERDGIVPTVFERITALAMLYFHVRQCDIVVLEVGMGGRLDATNVIPSAEVSIITSIGFDHMAYLGNTLPEIAREKAGIIHEGGHVVCSPEPPDVAEVFVDRCYEKQAGLTILSADDAKVIRSTIRGQEFRTMGRSYTISLLGDYQIINADVAVHACHILSNEGWKITEEDVRNGLAETNWPGRFERISDNPCFIVDGAHNPDGVKQLEASLRHYFPGRKITFIAGVLADKDYREMFRIIEPIASRFLTVTPESSRALPADRLRDMLREDGCPAESCSDVTEAVMRCLSLPDSEVVCAFGSLYYIGLVREAVLQSRKNEKGA